jgi:hypothetical protein
MIMTESNNKNSHTVILKGDNFSRWKLSVKASLSKTDVKLWAHIDPDALPPTVPAQAGAAMTAYSTREATGVDKIISTIDDNNFIMIQSALNSTTDDFPSRTAFGILQHDHANVSATLVNSSKNNLQSNYFRPTSGDPDAMGSWLSANEAQYNKIVLHGGTLTERDFVLALVRRTPTTADFITLAIMVELADPESPDCSKQTVFRNLRATYDRSIAQGVSSRDNGRGNALVTTTAPAPHSEMERFADAIVLLTAQMAGKGANTRTRAPGANRDQHKKQWRTRTHKEQQQLEADIKLGICNLHRFGKCKHPNCKYRHVPAGQHEANIAYSLLTTVITDIDVADAMNSDSDDSDLPSLIASSSESDGYNSSDDARGDEAKTPNDTGDSVPDLLFSDTSATEPSSDDEKGEAAPWTFNEAAVPDPSKTRDPHLQNRDLPLRRCLFFLARYSFVCSLSSLS